MSLFCKVVFTKQASLKQYEEVKKLIKKLEKPSIDNKIKRK